VKEDSWLKWKIAYLLDFWTKKCWGDLVHWALGYIAYNEIGMQRGVEDCGYCGKCEGRVPWYYGKLKGYLWRKLHPKLE